MSSTPPLRKTPVDQAPLDRATVALREIILAGEHYRHTVAGYLGLTISESQAASYLYARGDMGQTELGDALGFNTSSTTALIDRLERNGIAERHPHPTDRRRSTVRLSTAGRKTIANATGWITHAFDNINPSQLSDLTTTLQTLAHDLRTSTNTIPGNSTGSDHVVGGGRPRPRRRR